MSSSSSTIRLGAPRLRHMRYLGTFTVVLVLLTVWQVGVSTGFFPSLTPGPLQVGWAIAELAVSPSLWLAAWSTVSSALLGWIIAIVFGVILGMLFGSVGFLQRSTTILVDFGRSFPMLALLPVVILILGTTLTMKVFLITLACFWPIIVQAIDGARRMDSTARDMVRVHRVPLFLVYWRVRIPGAMPFIATGVRLAASIALIAAVAVEVLTDSPGLGERISAAQEIQSWDIAFAYLFYSGLLGWVIVASMQRFEEHALVWNRRAHD